MSKIKVINVISDSNIGGAGNILLTFLRNFDREKFEMIVVLPEKSLLIPKLEQIVIKYTEVKGLAEKSFDFKTVLVLKKIFKKEQPDIVHAHASMSARIAAKLSKCKIIYTRHSFFRETGMKTKFPFKQIFGFINNTLSDVIIAVSPAVIGNLYGVRQSKIKIVYNGVEPLNFVENEKQDEFVCTIAARLVPEKGHEYVLGAAKLLQEANSGVKIMIAGTGPSEEALKQCAEEFGLTNCSFLGFFSDIKSLFAKTNVQLNASYGTEATSLSLLEGMSMGIPAIVSDFGGNPFVIQNGENGMVVPEKNAEALFEAIIDLKNNKEKYEKMSERAVEIYKKRFTAKIMTASIEEIYENV